MDLQQYREQIDAIDDEMVKLIVSRLELAGKIAGVKQSRHLPVFNPRREHEIIIRLAKAAGSEYADYIRMIYGTLFDVSRAHQYELNAVPGRISSQIESAWRESAGVVIPHLATVACQGAEGAFSGIAAQQCFPMPDITWVKSFRGVAQAVEGGLCDYGVLPVENSTYGTVNQVYDLMLQHRFYVVKSIRVHVSHALLAAPGASLDDITEVVSHPQALGQCELYLSAHPKIKATPVANTAVAAQMVASSGRRDLAAIASRECAGLYGLPVLADGIQDNANNYTRFICITRKMTILPGANRISLILSLPHQPGALYAVLAKFAALGLNLLKLESRPAPGSDFEFRFCFDLAAPAGTASVLRLLDELEHDLDLFTFLGWYSEQQRQ